MKRTISAEEFVAAVNSKMREHPDYTDGMYVEWSPKKVLSPIGTQVVGPLPAARDVATWAHKATLSRFEVRVSH